MNPQEIEHRRDAWPPVAAAVASARPAPARRATALRSLRTGTYVLAQENIDTDQIVPARFLVESGRTDWGEVLFAGWRTAAAFDRSASPQIAPPGRSEPPSIAPREASGFDAQAARGRGILIAGRNFGCGSSREHAAWALRDFGFRVVIAPSIADIFRRNALKNGVLAIDVPEAVHAGLQSAPGAEVEVDLERSTLTLPDGEPVAFAIDRFARHCLLEGLDELAFLLRQDSRIEAFEDACPRRSLAVPVR